FMLVLSLFLRFCFFSLSGDHRYLHSFPTRRSSDLLSVAVLDFVQMVVIMAGLLFIGWVVAGMTGGVGTVVEHAAQSGRLDFFPRSEEHTSELQSRENLVCRLLLEKKKKKTA